MRRTDIDVRELLWGCVLPLALFAACRSLAASWYSTDLSGIPDEGQVHPSLLPWFLYTYDSGGPVWSDGMRARTWLVSCAGYFVPALLAGFAARRTSTQVASALLLGALTVWTVVAIPAPPAQAQYYTAATVTHARWWIATLAVAGAVIGVLARELRRAKDGVHRRDRSRLA